MTYNTPNTVLVLRAIEEEILDMVLAVEILPYQLHHTSDQPWPVLPTAKGTLAWHQTGASKE